MSRPRPLVVAASFVLLVASSVRAQPAVVPGPIPLAGSPLRRGEAVVAWMNARLGTFGLEDGVDSLSLELEEPLPAGGARVLVQQFWHGLRVTGADARAIVDGQGRLTSLIVGFDRGLRAPLAPRIAPGFARDLAAHVERLSPADAPDGATLTVQRRADGDHLVWDMAMKRADGEPFETRVDAVSGDVLDVDAGVAHAVGRVYPTDPRQPLEERELFRLLPGPPLRSSILNMSDLLAPPVEPVTPGDYRLFPEDPGFDQVNLYWHIDHYFHDFWGPLGYAGLPDSLIVRIHFPLDPEVARVVGNYITFGNPIPDWANEPTRSHDIVYHELGHAVFYGYGIQPGGPHREANALHEGLADYFAAAFTGDPAIGEWEYLRFPRGMTRVDQPNPPWDMAHYDQVDYGPTGPGTSWANGMILSSTLWDLRQRLGSTCDSLVLEALAYVPTIPTWAQFENGLFLADRDHHAGLNWRTIGEALRHRGIRGVVSASIIGPTDPPRGEPAEFHALDCCGGTPGHYQWRVRSWCRGVPCGPWRDLGDADSIRVSLVTDSQLELSVESPFGDLDSAFTFVRVNDPSLEFAGPTRVAKGTVGTWSLRVVAAAPFRMFVYRQWLVPGGTQELLGTTTSYTFAANDPFQLTAQLTDWLARSAIAQVQVETFVDRPPRSADQFVRLTQTVEGGHRAEVHVETAEATTLRLGVFDVHGRERVALADYPTTHGERVIRWDAGELESGIYFLRAATATGHSAVVRFALLH